MNPFDLVRKDIKSNKKPIGVEESLSTDEKEIADTEDVEYQKIQPVTGLSIDANNGQEGPGVKVINMANKTRKVEIILEWDDQPGIEEYEVWIGREMDDAEN